MSVIFEVATEYSLAGSSSSFLTGEVEERTISSDSAILKDNLKAAKKIIEYTQKTVLFSINHPRRTSTLKLAGLSKLSENQLEHISKVMSWIRSESPTATETTKFIKKCQVGNCSEMSLIAFEHAKSENYSQNIEVFSINHGDHIFLVIGRTSDSKNPQKWNKEAVVCDPWSGSYYPVTLISQYLKDFIELVETQGDFHTKVSPYSLKNHSLKLLCSDMQHFDNILQE